jgi:hypothetical protein
MVAYLDGKRGGLGKPQIHARPETNQADAFSARHNVSGLFPGNDATCDPTRDLLEFQVPGRSGEREDILLILQRSLGVPSGKELPRAIVQPGDGSRGRRAVDVNVPDREKNADAPAGAAGVFLVRNHDDFSIRRSDNGPFFWGDFAFGVPKKRKNKEGEKAKQGAGNRPAQEERGNPKRKRRNSEVEAFFDHARREKESRRREESSLREPARSFYDSFGRMDGLLRVVSPRALDAGGNPLHFVLAVELHFFQFDFFQEVFRTVVGSFEDSLQFCI